MADAYNMQYEKITEEDVFDIYGYEYLLGYADAEVTSEIEQGVKEIHSRYLAAAKKRAAWVLESVGVVNNTPDSLRSMANSVTSQLEKNIENSVLKQQQTGLGSGGLMGAILSGYQESNADLTGVDVSKFGLQNKDGKKQIRDRSKIDGFGLSEWKDIAEAYFNLEDATTTSKMILAIDHLNDLQHCGGNLLVDFQLGYRAGEGKDGSGARDEQTKKALENLKAILDIKRDAKSPKEFLPKMSSTVRRLWAQCRGVLPRT